MAKNLDFPKLCKQFFTYWVINCLKKNDQRWKSKNLIVPFHVNVPFLYPLKTSKSRRYKRYRNGTLLWNGFISWICTKRRNKNTNFVPSASLRYKRGWRRLIKPLETRLIKTRDHGNLNMELWALQKHFSPSYFLKRLYWKISQNSQGNICSKVLV